MFNLSTQDVVSSIEKAPLVNLDGMVFQEYDNFFGKEWLERLEADNFNTLKFVKLQDQYDRPRSMIDYSEKIMKELKVFFMQSTITKSLSKKFECQLAFSSVDIWKDEKGYTLPAHADDTRIKLAIQIYLGEDNMGTSLYDKNGNKIKTFKYTKNSGYALLNNKCGLHGLDSEVTNNGRLSVYARYS